jgi:two-component system, OmpR family, response regulator ChvI
VFENLIYPVIGFVGTLLGSVLAFSNFKSNFYSLSILDINMPKMNGYESYREIRKLDNKVKVCFLTAPEVYDESLRTPPPEILRNAKHFISKPLALADLEK